MMLLTAQVSSATPTLIDLSFTINLGTIFIFALTVHYKGTSLFCTMNSLDSITKALPSKYSLVNTNPIVTELQIHVGVS